MRSDVLVNLPVVTQEVVEYENLEADLAMANKRVAQATRRRDELLEQMVPPPEGNT